MLALYIALGWTALALPVAVVIGLGIRRADVEAEVDTFREELSALG